MQKQSYVEDIKGIFKVEPNKQTKDNQKTNRKYNIIKIEQYESHQKPGCYKQNDMWIIPINVTSLQGKFCVDLKICLAINFKNFSTKYAPKKGVPNELPKLDSELISEIFYSTEDQI